MAIWLTGGDVGVRSAVPPRMLAPFPPSRLLVLIVLALVPVGLSVPAVAGPSELSPPEPAASSDSDDDGLPDDLEPALGTEPDDPDSDDDGIRDGVDPDVLAFLIASIPTSAFRDADSGLKKASLSRLDDVESLILAGDIDGATRVLKKNLRRRFDGCPPKADKDDWITECSAQLSVRSLLDLQIANHFSFTVNPSIAPSIPSLPGLGGGSPRPVAVAVGSDGTPEEFLADELVLHTDSPEELASLLARYGGTVLRDGTPAILEGTIAPPGLPPSTGWYLVRINPSLSSLEDMDAVMEEAGFRGSWSFSSEDAARLTALAAREQALGVSPNYLMALSQWTVSEHPDGKGGHLDASKWWWMTEDDDPSIPGDQGLSVGVIHAWEYVKYKGYPPLGTPYTPLKVAIIDAGFDLDETTGVPLYGGPDYSAALTQIDAVNGDWTAGGLGYGFPNCPNGCWHGQMSFGTCCALANNGWGTAGTSGGWEVKPLVIKVSGDIDTVSSAVYNAIYNNADVIAEAAGFICGWGCRNFGGGNVLKAAVGSARNHGAIFVTPANNQGQDISNVDQYPCVLNGAVCVGAVTSDGLAAGYSNWGSVVDIWAPTDVLTTVTRDSGGQPYQFGGTSASGPYLAGIVALMKMLDPDLTYDEVRSILVSTANASADPKVSSRGYVDAYRAVAAAKPNLSPMVAIAQPANNASPDYHEVYFSTQVTDPETPSPLWGPADFPSKVVVSSDRNGELCSAAADATGTGTTISCYAAKDLDPGVHTITATATDPFGATGSHAITINVVNDPPTTVITFPASGSTYYTSQMVNLRGYGFDPDLGQYLPDASLSWSSSLGGALGTGSDIWASLTAGTHTITLTAVDELGVSGSDSISITVQTGVGYPTVQILKPANGDTVGSGTAVTFEGRATDPEDGTITEDARFKWYSSRDGLLGTGRLIQSTLSTVGESAEHIITLEVTDSDGHTATHAIKVYVVSPA